MPRSRKFLLSLLIILLAIGWNLLREKYLEEYNRCENVLQRAHESQLPKLKVYFNDAIYKESREVEKILACYLDQAKKTIDIHAYQANLQNIRDALIRAKQRGVQVRFITDDHYANHASYYRTFYDHLTAAGILLIHDQVVKRTNGQSHNKFVVVDGRYTWTGSMNLTDNGTRLNANNALWIDSSLIAATYTQEFEEMWGSNEEMPNIKRSRFGSSKTLNTQAKHRVEGLGEVEICFDPSDNCKERILNQLATADSTVYFASFSMTDDDLTKLLLEKHRQGVQISGIFDRPDCKYGEYAKLKAIIGSNILQKYQLRKRPRLIHHKFFIIDPETESDPTVITGSRNFSKSSDSKNDENTIIIHNSQIAKHFLEEWKQLTKNIDYATKINTCDK